MFATRAGEKKQQLTYAEAARWLLFINGYDDTSAKPRKKDYRHQELDGLEDWGL